MLRSTTIYLKGIINNKLTSKQVIVAIQKEVTTKVTNAKQVSVAAFETTKEEIGVCPICSKAIQENKQSYYCVGYRENPKCTFALWKNDKFLISRGKALTKTIAKSLIKNGKASVKGLKQKDGNTYDANIVYIQNGQYYNLAFENSTSNSNTEKKLIGKCPRCKNEINESSKAYYCSGYFNDPKCTFSIWKNNRFLVDRGLKLTDKNVKEFLANGKTLIKNIHKKGCEGKYDAIIKIEDTGTYINLVVDEYIAKK